MKLRKQCQMRTVNRSPIKTYIWWDGSVRIEWKCHGIDQDGNRQRWHEVSFSKDGKTELHAPGRTGRGRLYLERFLAEYEHSKGLQS